MSFGTRVRMLRESKCQSLEDLAVSARIPSVTLMLIESDRHYPRLHELERLLAALQVKLRDLQLP